MKHGAVGCTHLRHLLLAKRGIDSGYPRKTGQLEDSHRDLKCRKARPRWLRIQKPEALMLQSVPPYVDTLDADGR